MKFFTAILFSLLIFLSQTAPRGLADENFDVTSHTLYDVDENGRTAVTQTVEITNKKEFIHAPAYTITLNVAGIEEMQVVSENGASIPFTVNDTPNGGKKIKVVFPERVVGEGTRQEFTLKYKTTTLVHRLGSSWEVNIPGVKSDEFTSSQITVTVPSSMGKASLVKPRAEKEQGNIYTFSSETLGDAGALLIFGDTEYYRLQLTYTLENANFFPLRTEIALPPTTSYQEVIFKGISPRPKRIYTDADGNYLAEYTLDPQQEKIVQADVLVKISADPQLEKELSEKDKSTYTKNQKYWEKNADIQRLAEDLATPEKIYNYIIAEFSYNHSRTADASTRLGASKTLSDRDNLVCLEFTDLFVAIARAAGIAARSVEGYAYTQNPSIRPRALVQDVLHAWPEYYDAEKKKWIMVDPTWGNTTAGIDYFHSMDTSHIAFVRKGVDSQYPIPAGGYKNNATEKQVKVSFASPDDFEKAESVVLSAAVKKITNPLGSASAVVSIQNSGNTPILGQVLSVTDQNGTKREFILDNIPPLGTQEFEFPLNSHALTKAEHQLTMQLGEKEVTVAISSGLATGSIITLTGGGLFGALILGLSVKGGSVYFQRRRK